MGNLGQGGITFRSCLSLGRALPNHTARAQLPNTAAGLWPRSRSAVTCPHMQEALGSLGTSAASSCKVLFAPLK